LSYWNYRVIRTTDEKSGESYLQIHEVYYSDEDRIRFTSENPIAPGGEDIDELRSDLDHMMEATAAPILEWNEVLEEIPGDSTDWEAELATARPLREVIAELGLELLEG
jgi:hypothetical protein